MATCDQRMERGQPSRSLLEERLMHSNCCVCTRRVREKVREEGSLRVRQPSNRSLELCTCRESSSSSFKRIKYNVLQSNGRGGRSMPGGSESPESNWNVPSNEQIRALDSSPSLSLLRSVAMLKARSKFIRRRINRRELTGAVLCVESPPPIASSFASPEDRRRSTRESLSERRQGSSAKLAERIKLVTENQRESLRYGGVYEVHSVNFMVWRVYVMRSLHWKVCEACEVYEAYEVSTRTSVLQTLKYAVP